MSDIITRGMRTRRRHLTFMVYNGKRRESATEQRSVGEKCERKTLADYRAARRCPEVDLEIKREEETIPLHNGVFLMRENVSFAEPVPDRFAPCPKEMAHYEYGDDDREDEEEPFGSSDILTEGGFYTFMKNPCGRRIPSFEPDRNYEWPH